MGIKCQTYPEALGDLTKEYFTIAVAGTHGKSTTTAMLALILIKAGLDPTVIVGTKLKEFGNSNFRMGKPSTVNRQPSTVDCQMSDVKCQMLLIEACEHEASFLNYSPNIIVLTNIEKDHLDYYKNLNNILKAFRKFVGLLEKGGTLVANKDDSNILQILNPKSKAQIIPNQIQNPKLKIINYSLKQKEAKKIKQVLKVPGEYNVYNALACLAVARCLKIPDKISFKALSEYKGCWRRFEIKKIKIVQEMQCACCEFARHCGQESHELQIILDYAHHPTEIKACLQGAREKFPKKKIWCVFQPHQYQRTFYLFKDFVKVFQNALDKKIIDELIITDIYDVAGREDKKIKLKVSSKKMIEKIGKNSIHLSDLLKTEKYLKTSAQSKDIIMVVGAGDIYKLFN
jgi:UDP-N-acetylmuramate--alanine ligase